ncbi:winged helix-turn-helix transcriptional regulator [Sinirhodobacter populi]|uniref:Winged helix-turn-helix transcriptional regulator n=1 Tax=Paenirhodobacter populi TaxID=2306993 RepID=A0A443K3K2_9RHOB|nr:winged helix-turn-helix transcriptional regulator [Sinirhodobacter populi]RWR27341.1 winged helix-turn-helix transcriptional regulator [Sinirhodobacter populi]
MHRKTPEILGRRNAGAGARRQLVLDQLCRPRTQTELQDRLGMSRTGTLHLLRRMAQEGLIRPAEKIGVTRIWERESP